MTKEKKQQIVPGNPEPISIAEWPLNNRGETVRVSIDHFKGTALISIRKWFKVDDGSMCPGKGLAMGAKHLPRLKTAVDEALAAARERGLISVDDEVSQ